ncbi:UvrB/UvrC motif-containing protein [Candidatus Kaiserbacteria bacterium]|nr:UvrB/UvrC motif-containing protein [Candidatus Kaiserbacteria bacterium]
MTKDELKKFKLPDRPGVYIFKKGRKILYIGKATNLRDRVRSYFAADLVAARGGRVVGMVEMADRLSSQTTGSVLEALILEAELIKRHQPPYNVDEKDNKSWNYVVITKEDFPRVLLVRGRELYSAGGGSSFGGQKWDQKDVKYTFGPFPHGMQLQEAVKTVRRIFPFRDSKCIPCGQGKNKPCRPCFNRQIGLCPGVCTGEVSKVEYARTIRNIKDLFSANFHGLKRRLAREMRAAARSEHFEEATKLRRQISALEHIRDVSLIKSENKISSGGGVRIEAYDVAHTGGSETVAVMTVVSNGEKLPAAYRKFEIHSATNNDTAALREVLERRLGHPEWPLPRVFVVDGGIGQMNAAKKVLNKAGISVPLVGVVKNEFHKPERLIGDRHTISVHEHDILLANSEAHRFAITWHRSRRRRAMGW